MTRSRAGKLIRKSEQPPHAGLLELFFDLVFVFALTRVSQRLHEDATAHARAFLGEAAPTLLLLLALLMVWFVTAWVTDLYDAREPGIQLVIGGTMLGSLLMAVSLPQAFGNRGLAFVSAYIAIHIGRGVVLVYLLRGHEAQRRAAGALLWFAVSAGPWIVGAILPEGTTREVFWTLAIAIDYTGAVLLWPAPWTGQVRAQWPVVAEHLADRYRQFFIIALGESIIVAGATYSGTYFGTGSSNTAAFLVSFATTALLWRIYTYRAAELLPAAISAASNPARLVQRALVAHLFMVVGTVTISAGYALVIAQPLGHTDPAWITVMLVGPALFIVGRAIFEHAVSARVSWDRVIGLLVLAALAPVMFLLPPLAVATTAMAVLFGIAIADAARRRRHPSDVPPTPAGEPS